MSILQVFEFQIFVHFYFVLLLTFVFDIPQNIDFQAFFMRHVLAWDWFGRKSDSTFSCSAFPLFTPTK